MVGRLAAMAEDAPIVEPSRLAAWRALSELFLDTERDDADITVIARELAATGLPVDELERIFEEEVAPACWRNLRSLPGGAWTGFDERWLVDAIRRQRHRGVFHALPLVRKLRIKRWTRDTRDDWNRVRRSLDR